MIVVNANFDLDMFRYLYQSTKVLVILYDKMELILYYGHQIAVEK